MPFNPVLTNYLAADQGGWGPDGEFWFLVVCGVAVGCVMIGYGFFLWEDHKRRTHQSRWRY